MAATLPQFTWDHLYEPLHVTLWPAGRGPVEEDAAPGEPLTLRDLIKTLTPDDGWLTPNKKSESNTMDVDGSDGENESEGEVLNDDEDVDIRYINLEAHPALVIDDLGEEIDQYKTKATFVVRREYEVFMEHAMSRVSDPPDDSFRARFFVTGQPGIGKSFGCYYFLFRLLALGQPVFFVNSLTTVYYFSSDGIQLTEQKLISSPALVEALRGSWVLIDMDDKTEWQPSKIFKRARCVVWTSPPRELRMKEFIKRFGAETWYMKAWSPKEIAAMTERMVIDPAKVLKRLSTGGPVARSLWGALPVPSPQTIDTTIRNALSGNIFAFMPNRVFLIQPLVVIDEESGRAYLQRTDYSAEFISTYIANRTSDLAQDYLERLQGQLASALNSSTTRSVAGKLFEGIIYRALTRGMQLPAGFGRGSVAGTLELVGKAESFVCEAGTTDIAEKRPLYLRPESLNFAAVDAILVTNEKLGLIQASMGQSHRRDFGMMLRIMSRLPRGAQVGVSGLRDVIYCLVGIVPERVQTLVAEASGTLAGQIAHTRLSTFRVVGY
ncbi:hypothetical protein GGX14DRAFT_459840, partial [Mycena pura]